MELFRLLGTVAIDNQQAIKDMENTTKVAGQSEKKMSSAFKKIGVAVAAAFASGAVVSFGKACIEAAAESEAMASQFSQVFGDLETQASENLTDIADSAGIMVNRMKGSYTKIAAFAKTTGMETADALSLADRAMVAVADSAAFYDRSLEETTESLQSFLKGNFENDAALGLSCTEVTRNAAAVKLFGKEYNKLSEAQKQLTLLQMVEDANKMSGAMGQAAREADTWSNQTGNLQQAWTDFSATVGKLFLPTAIEIVKKLTSVVNKLQQAAKWVDENRDTIEKWGAVIASVTAGIATFIIAMNWGSIMGAASSAVKGVAASVALLNTTIKKNPIAAVISLIVSLISYFAILYKTNDEFRAKVDKAWGLIKERIEELKPVLESIIQAISPVVEDLVARFKEMLPTIEEVIAFIGEALSTIIPIVADVIGFIITKVQDFLNFVMPYISAFFDWLGGIFSATEGSAGSFLENIKAFFQSAWDFIKGVWEACQPFFEAIWNRVILPVAGMIKELIGAFLEGWKMLVQIWEKCAPFFEAIWEGIKGAVKILVDVLGSFFKNAWEVVKNVWDVAVSFFTSIFAGVKAVFSTIGAVLGGNFEDAWENIKNAFSKFGDFFKELWEGVKETFSAVGGFFKDVFEGAWEGIKLVFSTGGKIFEGIASAIGDVFTSIVNLLIKGINEVIAFPFDTINGILNGVREIEILDFQPFEDLWDEDPLPVPQIPQLAKGGVLKKGQVGLLEGDGAEAVVPLEKNKQWIDRVAEDMDDAIGGGESVSLLRQIFSMLQNIYDEVASDTSVELNHREFARLVRQVN